MEPFTIGAAILSSFIFGGGAGAAAMAHRKNKVIAKLQNKLSTLQKKHHETLLTIRRLSRQLRGQAKVTAILEYQFAESEKQRNLLIDRIDALMARKKQLESLAAALYYLLTMRWSSRKRKIGKINSMSSKVQLRLEKIEKDVESLSRDRAEVASSVDVIREGIANYKGEVLSLRQKSQRVKQVLKRAKAG